LRLNNRPPLLERRRDHLAQVRRLQEITRLPDVPPKLRAEASAWLARGVADDAEYVAMTTRAALR
jgi:hypothetical protein